MKAIVLTEHGGPDVLRAVELPDPVPAAGEVLARVRACALNHLDLWTRRGSAGRRIEFPHVLGSDIAGELVSIGSPQPGLRIGQRVMLSPGTSCGCCQACLSGQDNSCRNYHILGHGRAGGYAELVCCPAANVIPLPDDIEFAEAAAFPLVFLTAWHMLVTRARLQRGESVLVWAAGSGVGMAAVQLARLFGAHVFATAGQPAKLELARELGATVVFDHHHDDVVGEIKRHTGKRGVDVVVEHVGAATWERSVQSLAPGGRLVTCGATTGPQGATDLRYLFAKQLSLLGSYMGSKAELLQAAKLFFARELRTVVHATLPLAEARRAHEMLEASQQFGKIVLLA